MEEGGGGRPGRVLLAACLANIPKSPRVEAASSTVRDLRGNCMSAASLKDHKHIFSSFLIYFSTEMASMDPTPRGGCWSMSGNHKSTGLRNRTRCEQESPAFKASLSL